jgi:hypothetical protein
MAQVGNDYNTYCGGSEALAACSLTGPLSAHSIMPQRLNALAACNNAWFQGSEALAATSQWVNPLITHNLLSVSEPTNPLFMAQVGNDYNTYRCASEALAAYNLTRLQPPNALSAYSIMPQRLNALAACNNAWFQGSEALAATSQWVNPLITHNLLSVSNPINPLSAAPETKRCPAAIEAEQLAAVTPSCLGSEALAAASERIPSPRQASGVLTVFAPNILTMSDPCEAPVAFSKLRRGELPQFAGHGAAPSTTLSPQLRQVRPCSPADVEELPKKAIPVRIEGEILVKLVQGNDLRDQLRPEPTPPAPEVLTPAPEPNAQAAETTCLPAVQDLQPDPAPAEPQRLAEPNKKQFATDEPPPPEPSAPAQPHEADTTDGTLVEKQVRWQGLLKLHGGPQAALRHWVRSKFDDALPGRDVLLEDHRKEFGYIRGISQPAMRLLRAQLIEASAEGSMLRKHARGGAPTHRAHRYQVDFPSSQVPST